MQKNLLFISKLTKDNDSIIIFSADQFFFKDKQGRILAKKIEKDGLYALEKQAAIP